MTAIETNRELAIEWLKIVRRTCGLEFCRSFWPTIEIHLRCVKTDDLKPEAKRHREWSIYLAKKSRTRRFVQESEREARLYGVLSCLYELASKSN